MKKHIYAIFFTGAVAISASSCDKGLGVQTGSGEGIKIEAAASIADCAQTKAPVFPTGTPDDNGYMAMPSGSTFGLFICKHSTATPNPYEEHSADYNNIEVYRYSSSWQYTYGGRTESSMYIILQKEMNDKGQVIIDENGEETIIEADMFAYAPYKSGVASPEYVPFNIKNQEDLMYCIENIDPDKNKKINPRTIAEATAPGQTPSYQAQFSFKHLLTLLEFNFTMKNNSGTYSTLTNIKVEKGNESAVLYTSGSMDALSGRLENLSQDGTLSVSQNSDIYANSKGGKAYLMMVPNEDYKDDDYIFEFTFNGISLTNSRFVLKKEYLRHGTSDEYGLKAGYKYTFNFIIDNYIHFKNIEVGQWTEQTKPLMGIEI